MTTSQLEFLTDFDAAEITANLKNAIVALREGRVILLLDDNSRENEGDLIVAAEKITEVTMNFLIKRGSGVVCLALPKKRLDHLGLPLMIPDNTNFFQTAFTVSIEASSGVTTGVSAKDRTHTILVAMADNADSTHLARPGHVFPLAARKDGVFDRMGHTEGSVDLMKIAGLKPGAVLCELMNEDGSMTIGEDRVQFARKFNIPVVSVEEVFCCRMLNENIVSQKQSVVNTRFGELMWYTFTFFDSLAVDVFCRKDWEQEPNPKKLSMVSANNLQKRFMAQILEQSADDPLIGALQELERGSCDFALMTTCNEVMAKKSQEELALRTHAAISRTLRELNIQEIADAKLDSHFKRIAREYFSIKFR